LSYSIGLLSNYALIIEHKNFKNAVLGKQTDIVTLEEGAYTVKIAEAIIESYTHSRLVKFSE
jgi:predicted dehydrogenase